jgi:acetyl esterase/lipase
MPGFKTLIATLTGTVAVAATLAACSSPGQGTGAAAPSATPPHDCPTATLPTTGTAGQPAGQAITMATSVAASDTSTSTVLTNLNGPQIQCGRTALDTYSDIVFATPTGTGGTALPLKLDIQVPRTDGPKPLVVYVTGGGFVMAPKENGLNLRTYVAEAGYAVASIQYRTVPDGATYADGVADVKSAIRYLRAHAGQYRIDPNQVAVWGESAGGYLASMVGTTNGRTQFDAGANLDQSSAVQAVVDKFGPSDLDKLAADFDPAMQRYTYLPGNSLAHWAGVSSGRSILDDPAADARANPITYVTNAAPPFLIMHGSADKLVSPSQTLLLHTALLAAGVDSTRYVLTGANHGDLAFLNDPTAALPWSTQEVMNHIVTFLNGHLRRQ